MDDRDEMLARLMAGESVPEADAATRREAALLKLAIQRSFEADVSEEQKAHDKAKAFERAKRQWAAINSPEVSASVTGADATGRSKLGVRGSDETSPSWLERIQGALSSLMPRPMAWTFATIAIAVIGVTLGILTQDRHDDPFQIRGSDVQTVTLAVPDPAIRAENIRARLAGLGLKVRVRVDGVFHFVDVADIPLPPEPRVRQAFVELKLPEPTASHMEVGLRPEE